LPRVAKVKNCFSGVLLAQNARLRKQLLEKATKNVLKTDML
jgi:hypothetical protein